MRWLALGSTLLAAVLGLASGCGQSEGDSATPGGAGTSGASSTGGSAGKAGSGATAGSATSGSPSGGNSVGGTTATAGASGSATTGGRDGQAEAGAPAGGAGGLVDCDPKKIVCKRVAPLCDAFEVPSVEGTCYGECVKIDRCGCSAADQCPQPEEYTCWAKQHCGPYVQ